MKFLNYLAERLFGATLVHKQVTGTTIQPSGILHTIVPKEFLEKVGNNWDSDKFPNQIII